MKEWIESGESLFSFLYLRVHSRYLHETTYTLKWLLLTPLVVVVETKTRIKSWKDN